MRSSGAVNIARSYGCRPRMNGKARDVLRLEPMDSHVASSAVDEPLEAVRKAGERRSCWRTPLI